MSAIGGFRGCEFHIIFSFGGRATGGTSGGMNLRLIGLVDNGMNLLCFLLWLFGVLVPTPKNQIMFFSLCLLPQG